MSSLFYPVQPQQQLFQQQQPQQQQNQPQFQFQQQPQIQQQQNQPQFQFQQQPQIQQQQQHIFLFTNDKTPATYSTKWADLHPDTQKYLLQVEERILEYRVESQRLDQCNRLYDSYTSNEGFERDACIVLQDLGGISTTMERVKPGLQEIMSVVKEILKSTEVAIRSFMIIRPRYVRPNTGPSQASGAIIIPDGSAQLPAPSRVLDIDFYSGFPRRPSSFLQQAVTRFEKYLAECRQKVEELEQLLLSNTYKNSSNRFTSLQSLPKILSNIHNFFVHIAAKVECVHQTVESMKMAFLVEQRRRGDGHDPFLEADRREMARQVASAKRVHPPLQLPPVSNPPLPLPSVPPTGLPANNTQPTPAPAPPGSSSSAPAFATTPSAAPPAPLFGQPSFASPRPTPFGSSPSSLFGSVPTPPLFGGSAPTGTSLFSTPLAAVGPEPNLGTSRSSRPRRAARR